MALPRKCVDCGTDDGVAIYCLCVPCRRKRTVAQRAAQGLPTPSEDAGAYFRLARILDTSRAVAS